MIPSAHTVLWKTQFHIWIALLLTNVFEAQERAAPAHQLPGYVDCYAHTRQPQPRVTSQDFQNDQYVRESVPDLRLFRYLTSSPTIPYIVPFTSQGIILPCYSAYDTDIKKRSPEHPPQSISICSRLWQLEGILDLPMSTFLTLSVYPKPCLELRFRI